MLKVNQLSGFGGRGGAAASGGGGGALALLGSSTSANSSSLVAPASIIAGDLLIFHCVACGNAGDPTGTPINNGVPSGFTLIDIATELNTTAARATLAYKIAAGTEGGTTITGQTIGGSGGQVTRSDNELLVFRSTPAITAVTISDVAGQGTSTTPTTQTKTASDETPPLIVIGTYADYDIVGGAGSCVVNTRGMSPAKDGEVSAFSGSYMAYKIYLSSPANVDISMSDGGNVNIMQSCVIECAS